ncbi:MAG: ABC transporter permease [Dehalococcoidia bacterium]
MRQYLIQRLLLSIPTVIGVSIVVFMMVRLLPGDVVDIIISDQSISPEVRETIRKQFRLNAALHVQYWEWSTGLLRGDLGTDLLTQRPIAPDLKSRGLVTLELNALALLMALVISIPVGILAAVRQDSAPDYLARSTAIGMLALPNFWLGVLVYTVPSLLWKWTPPLAYVRFEDDPATNLYILCIPAAIMGSGLAGGQLRLIRTQLLEVLRQDYIRTAWAKGLRERTVIVRHALKNALIPVVTLVGIQVPILIGGAVVIEYIFSIPGLGRWLVDSILQRNYTVVQAINLVVAVLVVFVNLVVDMTYSYLDPRIRYR